MYLISSIMINSFSVILLCLILFYSFHYSEKTETHNKFFRTALFLNIFLLIFDVFGRFDGYQEPICAFLNHAGNFLLFALTPLLPSLWILYVYYYIHKEKKANRRINLFLILVNAANLVMVLLTLRYGWFYYIDESNVYHRGPLYIAPLLLDLFLLFYAAYLVLSHSYMIARKHYYSLLFFILPPFLCTFLQWIFYGYSFVYNGVTLSAFIILIYVQNQDVYTDYLTGIANRKKLEMQLKKMIGTGTHSFSAIMLDLDYFKQINDTLGHSTGDEALKTIAELLRGCLTKNDLLARYGGDEFCMILHTPDKTRLQETIDRINRALSLHNRIGNTPYKLCVSMGCSVYQGGMTSDEFLDHIDQLMYQQKRNNSVKSYAEC